MVSNALRKAEADGESKYRVELDAQFSINSRVELELTWKVIV